MKTKFNPGEQVMFTSVKGEIKTGQIEKISWEAIYYKDKKRVNYHLNYFLFGIYKAYKENDLKKIGGTQP